jgi:hypothetical protein
MFEYLGMMGDYEKRKIENTIVNGGTIDTARVNDNDKGYETGILHPLYSESWIIVEEYYSKEDAIVGHAKWVVFLEKELPPKLIDVGTSTAKWTTDSITYELKEV